VEREGARDRDPLLHPAGELPRVVVLEPGELDELDQLLHPRGAALAVPAEHLERERDVLGDGTPVVEDGVLEDHPVVAVEPRLVGRLPVDHDLALARLHQVADDAKQRRLAAARRAYQRNELARGDLEVDSANRLHAAREALGDSA
jgi:hypothetical protein